MTRSVLDLCMVFLLALAAAVTYLLLARHDVTAWILAPLLGYVAWAIVRLLTPQRQSNQRSLSRLGKVRLTREYYVRSGERNIWQP